MGQTGSVLPRLFDEEAVLNLDCYDGYFDTNNGIFGSGVNRYISLKPGCSASVEGSEVFSGGVVFMIAVSRNTAVWESVPVKLQHNGQSVAGLSPDRIYVLTIIDGIPAVPSLTQLDQLRAQQVDDASENTIERALKAARNVGLGVSVSTRNVSPLRMEFPNNGVSPLQVGSYLSQVTSRNVPRVGCSCRK